MKSINKYIIAAAALSFCTHAAFGQASYSGYFLDNYTHRYELNPALTDTTSKSFVTFPVLGNFNIGMHGNVGVKSFLYNVDGRTVLFTNPDVPTSTVLKNIKDKNRLGISTQFDILGVGFSAFGGKNAVTIGVVANVDANIPGSLIKMAKEGVANKTYDITHLRLNADAYAKIQLNHSRDIKQVPGLRAGAAIKFLLGVGNIDAYMNQAHLQLGEDTWIARTNADVYMNLKNAKYKLSHNDKNDSDYVSGINMDGFGLNGFGIGFDLGATYKWRDFNFSLAVLDLGFISWSDSQLASTNGVREISTSDFSFGTGSGEFDEDWDHFTGELSRLYELEDLGSIGGKTNALRATLNWGVEYTLPYYRNLTFGMVNTTRFNGSMTMTDFRFSANVQPVKCFSASANFSAGTFGVGFGWLANVNVKGFNFFIGMDRTLGKLAKQGIPLNSNAEVNLGINFPF